MIIIFSGLNPVSTCPKSILQIHLYEHAQGYQNMEWCSTSPCNI
jgi:hypothetical protein